MTDRELMQQTLETLQEINKLSVGENAICLPAEIDTAMDALRDRLAQPEQGTGNLLKDAYNAMVEKKTRSQRPWVGMTDEELAELSASGLALWDLWRAIEAKLKEKNT